MDKSFDEEKKIVLRGRGIAIWRRGFLIHSRGEIDKTDTFWVSGGSGAFRRSLWLKLGGLDPLYNPFYWEDIDLSFRAVKSGFKLIFEPRSVVSHYHKKGIIKRKFSPFFIKTISYRNQFFFIWKNITDKKLILSHLFWVPYHLLRTLFSLDLAFWLGLLLAFLKLPWVILSRQRNMELFTRTDEEILNQSD